MLLSRPIKTAHDGMCGYVKGLGTGTFEAMDQIKQIWRSFNFGVFIIFNNTLDAKH